MTYYAEVMEPFGSGRISSINGALKFIEKLESVNPMYLRANPILKQRIKKIQGQSRAYLAHEYFNKDWETMNFAKLNEFFAKVKLSYIAPSDHLNAIDEINLSQNQQKLLAEIKDPILYELAKDFCVNSQFRAEYWVKGPRNLSNFDQINRVRKVRVQLIENIETITLKINRDKGEVELSETIYKPILDFLSDLKTKSISEIESHLKDKKIDISIILQSIMILIGKRSLGLVQEEDFIKNTKVKTDKMNEYLIKHALGSDEIRHLVSPRTISGIRVGRIEKMFAASMQIGKNDPKSWANYAWRIITSQGESVFKNDKEILDKKEGIFHLTEKAEEFKKKRVPILKALMIL